MTDRQRLVGLFALVCAVGLALLETVHGPRSPSDETRGMLVVEIGDDGALTLDDGRGVEALGRLDAADVGASADAMEVLRARLRSAARVGPPSEQWDLMGNSRTVLRVVAGAQTPWAYTEWLMQLAGDPNLKLIHLRFALRGDGAEDVAWERPHHEGPRSSDDWTLSTYPYVVLTVGLTTTGSPSSTIALRFGQLTAESDGKGSPIGEEVEPPVFTEKKSFAGVAEFRAWLDGRRNEVRGGMARVVIARDSKVAVTSGLVLGLWSELRRAGVEDVSFTGAPSPLPMRPR